MVLREVFMCPLINLTVWRYLEIADHHHEHESHSHNHGHSHDHDHTHDPGVSSVSIVCDGAVNLDKVIAAVIFIGTAEVLVVVSATHRQFLALLPLV